MKGSFVFLIALIVGVIAAVLVNRQITQAKHSIKSDWDPVDVCVAARTLPKGHRIDLEYDTRMMKVPKNIAKLPDYVVWSERSKLHNQHVNTVLPAGKLIDLRFLGQPVGDSKNAAMVPDRGLRLISIKVNEVTGTAGHLRPYDKVDILHTSGDLITELILENVTVKHTGRPQSSRGKRTHYTTVTLEVAVREAMVITNAAATGTLNLIKRRSAGGSVAPEEARRVKPGNYREQLK